MAAASDYFSSLITICGFMVSFLPLSCGSTVHAGVRGGIKRTFQISENFLCVAATDDVSHKPRKRMSVALRNSLEPFFNRKIAALCPNYGNFL
jgi:hypothetical protein